jgi:hypothetical protein
VFLSVKSVKLVKKTKKLGGVVVFGCGVFFNQIGKISPEGAKKLFRICICFSCVFFRACFLFVFFNFFYYFFLDLLFYLPYNKVVSKKNNGRGASKNLTNGTTKKDKKMQITERVNLYNKPVFILSATDDITKNAINSFYRPWLEQLKEHADKGGWFYTYSTNEQINGFVKVYASKDVFAIDAKVRQQGIDTLYNQIWRASDIQIRNAKRKGYIEII